MDECVYPGTHWSEDNGSTSTATIIHSAYERNEVNGPLSSASSAIASTPLPPIDELQDEFQSTPIIRANRKRKPSTQDSSSDEESICQCPICFENWTNFGSHRIVSMKCGHLFGLSCIEKWITSARKDQKAKCPQCNSTISKREMRPIWAKRITSEDAVKIEQLQNELKAERKKCQEKEAELSKLHLAYEMCKTELTRKDSEIQNMRLQQSSDPVATKLGVALPTWNFINGVSFQKKLKLHNTANICRVLAFNPGPGMIVASKSTPEGIHGIQKISLVDHFNTDPVAIHSRAIRDLQCSQTGLCLTTALDATAKITSLKNNSVVQSYDLAAPGWCCSWDDSDENHLYCGLVDDSVMVFDVRNTREHIYHLKHHALTKKKPIHSIVHVGGPKNTILCANLDCLYKWEIDGDEPVCSVIEVETPGLHPYSLSYDKSSATVLASYRSQSSTVHMHGSIADTIFEVQNSYFNSQKQTALARTYHFSQPRTTEANDATTEYVICAGDEVNKSLCLWDDTNTKKSISIGSDVMDVKSAVISNQIYLAALTGNEVHIYRQ